MADQVTKSDQAYELIESMITFQELAPGRLISEAMLIELTGFGRTPVREALQRLAREAMVEIHPQRGVRVADISVESELQVLEIRRSLEVLTVQLAARRANGSQREAILTLAGMLEEFAGDAIRTFAPLLKRSHLLMAAAAHNSYLPAAMAPLQALSRRFWFANLRDVPADLRRGADAHIAILTAISKQDADAAAQASLRLNDYLTEFTHRVLPERQ
jgi:DNA-binding GntR family transcriptional regulator